MKHSKAEAHYHKGKPQHHCGVMFPGDKNYCAHFIPGTGHNGKCQVVEGIIEPQMGCDFFKRISARSS